MGKIDANSLDEVVTIYKKELYLKHPCPGSPFLELFQKDTNKMPIVGYDAPDSS